MNERDLLELWSRARRDLILSQLAPTALLGFAVWLTMVGLADAELATRVAAAGILLASGILGAAAQYSAAAEAGAIGRDLESVGASSAVASDVVKLAKRVWIVKFVTPAIFVVIFVALLAALFV